MPLFRVERGNSRQAILKGLKSIVSVGADGMMGILWASSNIMLLSE
jgi:hypothetical protein